jgi:hypothetical protein
METFGLKPVSKNALIRCIEQEAYGVDRNELAESIRQVDFGGVLIGRPEYDRYNDAALIGEVTVEQVPEFDSYCCFAVKAAICAVLGDDVQKFPHFEFTKVIRLNKAA